MIPENWDPNEYITGQANKDGESKMSESNNANTWSGEKKNYNEVVGDYTKQAYDNMNQSQIPDPMKDLVKDYFSDLN